MEMLLPVFAIIAGGYWSVKSFSYGMWVMNGPGGGLFPLVAGLLCVAFGIVILIRQLKSREKDFCIESVYPVLGVLGIIGATYVIGLIPALGVFVAIWLLVYERYSAVKALAIGIGTGVSMYLIFDYWLAVPVPMGLFEDLLYS